jgi:sugar phosphate isomerase/epimerase
MIKIGAMVGAPDLEKETLALYSGDLKQAFHKLAELGYEGVEIMMKDPAKLDGEKIVTWLEEYSLDLVGLCTGHVYGEDALGLVGPDRDVCKRTMKRLKSFIDFAGTYFGKGTLVNIGRVRGLGYENDSRRTLEEMEKAIIELAEYAGPSGVKIVIEPITVNQTPYINSTQDGIDLVKRVKMSNFGLMLDTYHMNIEDDDIYDSIRAAADLCWLVHFADNNRKYPGSAHLDFERIIATLYEQGYDGYVSMEIMPWPSGDEAARGAITYVRKYIQK